MIGWQRLSTTDRDDGCNGAGSHVSLKSKEQLEYSPPVVSLRFGETLPPLFMVAPGGANVFDLLASHIAGGRQIYGLQSIGIDAFSRPQDTVDEMAACLVRHIRNLQPDGPYLLAGFSFGGLIAFEIAHRLLNAGKDVALLALLDTRPHPRFLPLGYLFAYWRKRLHVHVSAAVQLPLREAGPHVLDRLDAVREHIRVRYSSRLWRRSESGPCGPEWFKPWLEITYLAAYRYRPRYYPGTITFFKSENSEWQPYAEFWAGLAKKLDVHIVHGNHHAAVETHAETVGRQLSLCIERAFASEGHATSSPAEVR